MSLEYHYFEEWWRLRKVLSSSALSAWVDNSLLFLHNFSDDAQRYPIIDNYNEIDKDDDNNTIMMMMMITIK